MRIQPSNPTVFNADKVFGGPAGIQGWSSHSKTRAKSNATQEQPDLGSIAGAVKGVALCQLCEQKAPQHQLLLQSRLV